MLLTMRMRRNAKPVCSRSWLWGRESNPRALANPKIGNPRQFGVFSLCRIALIVDVAKVWRTTECGSTAESLGLWRLARARVQ